MTDHLGNQIAEFAGPEALGLPDPQWNKPGARKVPWSNKPCLCKDEIGNSSMRHCPACTERPNDPILTIQGPGDWLGFIRVDKVSPNAIPLEEWPEEIYAGNKDRMGHSIQFNDLQVCTVYTPSSPKRYVIP